MHIELHIERLVLDGLSASPRERTLMRASLETELARLLTEQGLAHELSGGGAFPSLGADNIELSPRGDAWQTGEQIARAVYGGLGGR